MKMLVLSTSSRYIFPLLIIFALLVAYRGHNFPGGGFIGGLIAASAYILIALGEGVAAARKTLKVDPFYLIAFGLTLAVTSPLIPLLMGKQFMTGTWLPGIPVPVIGEQAFGTPVMFDIGVFFVVVGFSLVTIFSLFEEEDEA